MKFSLMVILLYQIFASQSELIKDPTLKPVENFSASTDAGVLKKELKDDTFTDRDKLAGIWFHRTYDERRQIQEYYNKNFCPTNRWGSYYTSRCPLSLAFRCISEDSMKNLYTDSVLLPENLLSKTIYEVFTDKWKEKGAIEEILCGNDKEMKDRISQFHQLTYKDTIESQLAAFRRDDQDYQHVMQQYCWKGLCQEKKLKPEDAEKEAKALRDIDPEKDKDGFKKKLLELLDNNCEPGMKMIFEKYRQDKNGIEDAVEKVFEVDRVERAYNRLVRYIENTCKFYADELHAAVDGCGTDIDKIIILTRCERDLGCIFRTYNDNHGETFTNRLRMDTSEDRYLESIRYLCGKI